MIPIEQLRVGNLLMDSESETLRVQSIIRWPDKCFLHSLDEETLCEIECEDLNPVPLSHEILKACGFEFSFGSWTRKDDEDMNLIVEFAGSHCQLTTQSGYVGNPFKYLHQLQNLFYALTSTELKYNEK